jgi:hypothetical protein
MMKYSFDNFGWYSSVEIPNRQTEVIPPICGTAVVGEPFPNFTGYEWIWLPYNNARNYALIKNGLVEHIMVSTLEFAQSLGYDEVLDTSGLNIGIGWQKQGETFIAPNVDNSPDPDVENPVLTPLEFINRFTDQEAKEIIALSKTNPDVELWWIKYNKASFINLLDPQTVSGVQALEYLQVIGQGRANEILSIS